MLTMFNVYFFSPKFDIPPPDPIVAANKAKIVCHLCSQPGHKSYNCPNTSASPSGNTYNPVRNKITIS